MGESGKVTRLGVVTIGDATLHLEATSQAVLFYRQQFGSDMAEDLLLTFRAVLIVPDFDGKSAESSVSAVVDEFDSTWEALTTAVAVIGMLRLAWAMGKTAATDPEAWPEPESWNASLGEIDLSDSVDAFVTVLQVALDGLFGTTGPHTIDARTGQVRCRPSSGEDDVTQKTTGSVSTEGR